MANAFHCRFETAVTCDDDDFNVGVLVFDVLEQFNALPVRQFLIQGDQINMLLLQDLKGGLRARRGMDGKKGAEDDFQRVTRARFVVDHQDRWLPY